MKSTQTIQPVLPVAAYLGGKRNLAGTIIERIEKIKHVTYAEPFVGMGGVFLRRGERPRSEVINDYNQEVATFFRVLQRHYIAFMDFMRFQITTRAEFDRLVKTDPNTLTDLERAARFFYLQRLAFGGKAYSQAFGVSVDRPARFDIQNLGGALEDLHTRLSGVVIECLPYGKFIERYDRAGTLFYLDPPYFGNEKDYGPDLFSRKEFELMAAQLSGIKGRFILSINDRPEVRALFAGFKIEPVKVRYTIGTARKGRQKAGELIISN